MYWDDRYGTETVSHEVLGRMKQLMVDNNTAASHSFLLDDDSSIPFSLDDISNLMEDKVRCIRMHAVCYIYVVAALSHNNVLHPHAATGSMAEHAWILFHSLCRSSILFVGAASQVVRNQWYVCRCSMCASTRCELSCKCYGSLAYQAHWFCSCSVVQIDNSIFTVSSV